MDQCFLCGCEMKQTTRTHVVDLKKCIVIVRNVPCLECTQCGEAYYIDEVQQRLDEIIQAVSCMMTEIAVIDYTDSAA